MKVLLTGATGFVGGAILDELVGNNQEVAALVRKSSDISNLKNCQIVRADYKNQESLIAALKGVDVVVHCGGIVRAKDRAAYFEANVENTIRLCEAALKADPSPKKFVFISSQAAMGPSLSLNPKSLDDEPKPVSDYGLSKLEAENALKRLLGGKIPYTILRPASVYGPRDRDIFIFFSLVHRHLKPRQLKKRFLQLLFVGDAAKAVRYSLYNGVSDNKTYFLAEKTAYTWEQVAQTIAKSCQIRTFPLPLPDFVFHLAGFFAEIGAKFSGKTPVLNRQKIKEMLQNYWICDTFSAENELKLQFTSLEKGGSITYNWYTKNEWLPVDNSKKSKFRSL